MFVDDSAGSCRARIRGAGALLCLYAILAVTGCAYFDKPAGDRGAYGNRAGNLHGAGRTPRTGVFHVVKKGENLYRIGKAYGVDHKTLARINHVTDTRDIQIGRRLFIPGAHRLLPVKIITPIKEAAPARAAAARTAAPSQPARPGTAQAMAVPAKPSHAPAVRPKAQRPKAAPTTARQPSRASSRQGFAWPVKGRVTGKFDSRPDSLNDGINIAAPPGTPVRATLAGRVIYSDQLRGYGNLIIVRHPRGYASVYAHNRKNLVRQGQKVNRRQVIAEVGATGRAATSYLHFEIRRNNVARDPLPYLP